VFFFHALLGVFFFPLFFFQELYGIHDVESCVLVSDRTLIAEAGRKCNTRGYKRR
jgi:hypothetical protein